ncbi:ATP-binding protein [Arthrobacter sp. NPDC089319]|uniref:ATP-binding protein n=1 Tax=Arthrobacter sp. NPDC089319 TaxID=3155915 RepID=UPI00343B3476
MTQAESTDYAERRKWYHANLTLSTPQLLRVHAALDEMLDADVQSFDRVRSAPVIDADPGVGKSTAANMYGRRFHRRAINASRAAAAESAEHIPVARIGLTGNTTPKSLALQMLEFYAHPRRTGNALQLTSSALDCVLRCRTQLIIIDDVHFLNLKRRDGKEVSNTLKSLANDFPTTFLFIGVGVEREGMFDEGNAGGTNAQLGRRWTRLEMSAFNVFTPEGADEWRSTLLGLEQALVLLKSYPGMLAEELSDYLFVRTTGYIGSLMELLRLGAAKAINTGKEALSQKMLDSITIAQAAEARRKDTQARLVTFRRKQAATASGAAASP